MTQPIQPVQSGPNDKEQAMIGLNHALLGAFHNLYLGKKRPVPPGLENMQQGLPPGLQGRPLPPGLEMQLHRNPGQQDISQQTPVAPPTPLQMPKQSISSLPLTAIAARLMGRRG